MNNRELLRQLEELTEASNILGGAASHTDPQITRLVKDACHHLAMAEAALEAACERLADLEA